MPLGLTNAQASFQNLVNDIFADFLDIFVVAYLYDIMVFSSSEEEHFKNVTTVLQRLRDNNLFSKASKCVFHASSAEYLGYVASSDGLKMDSSKAPQILNWPQPKNIKALQSSGGFSNFYCHFIKNYSKKITALTSLLKKDSPFIFNEEALIQLQILTEAFTTAPILSYFNPSLPTIVATDASDYSLGAVLSHVNNSEKHLIAFDTPKLLPSELNYEIHDKELLGIVWALKPWRAFLLSLSNTFEVLTDHPSLHYFMSSKLLTCCEACWSEFLSEFHFTITYCPGSLATLPDSLSHWDNMYPERGVYFIRKNPQTFQQVIKQGGIQESRFFAIKVKIFSDLVDKIRKEQCSRKKNTHHEKFGLLKPLQIPFGCWNSLSIDFITQLPLSNNFDSILVAVDRFLKLEIFIPTYGTITALELAQIFISHVFSKHRLPVSIVSDGGSLFVSSFWTNLCRKLKISRDISTSFHPGTDGQIERVNQILEKYLWIYVCYHQDDWLGWIPLAEFSYNNAEHSSTKQSPFFTIYGRNPSFNSIHISQDSPAGKLSKKLQSVSQAVKEELESAIRRFKKYADRNRTIPPDFQHGDKVWLASKNIKITRPTKKLSERWLGPFEALKIGSQAYQFKLPQQWKSVHPVFHVSLLEPVKQSRIPNYNQFPPPPV
ncbi:hypothetical protein O181_053416 [Austropuccinia psidii MF-1]|uniref:Integrase catalytic domain-containing protein n=1 Tax=Austropuccinia psidii MF-1 TaxID=1389203 RepID=A0A9Q3HQ68_9BASI|nr:hypothetical protein [Austropuccinia psidii MF-1]